MNINSENHAIEQPYHHIMLVLSYMKGPKINDWVQSMVQQIMERIDMHVNTWEDEALWNWFQNEFGMAYTDTMKKENAMTRMLALRMQQNNLDTYIAMFNNLWKAARWE